MKRNLILRIIISTLLCLVVIVPSMADVLTLPLGTKVIEEEAFYGDKSLDEVVLPEGIKTIGENAFANSSLKKINLPESLESMADNAIDTNVAVDIPNSGAGYGWAVNKRLRAPHGNATSGYFFINDSSEKATTGMIIEHDPENGDFLFACDAVSKNLLLQLSHEYSNVQYFAYCLNERPCFSDDTQINRRVGDVFFSEQYEMVQFVQLASYAFSNSNSEHVEPLICIPADDLKQANYCVLHIGFSKDGETSPSLWGSYAIKAVDSNHHGSPANWFEFGQYNESSHTCILTKYVNTDPFIEDVCIPEDDGNGYTIIGIASGSFESCAGLITIRIPECVETIGSGAFSGCSESAVIYMPDNTEYSSGAFSNSKGTAYVLTGFDALKNMKNKTFRTPGANYDLMSYYFESGNFYGLVLTSVDDDAISIELPAEVSGICYSDSGNFGKRLRSIYVDETSEYLSSENGVLYDKNKEILLRCPPAKTGTFYVPDSVRLIYTDAFKNSKLSDLEIFASDQVVIEQAFQGFNPEGTINIHGPSFVYGGTRLWYMSPTGLWFDEFGIGLTKIKNLTIPGSFTVLSNHDVSFGILYFTDVENLRISDESTTLDFRGLFENCNIKKLFVNVKVWGFSGSGYYNKVSERHCVENSWAWKNVLVGDKRIAWDGVSDPFDLEEDPDDPNTENMLSGIVTTESGEPISDVQITTTNNSDSSDSHQTYSRADGTWSVTVDPEATYNINYWHYTYNVEGNAESAAAGDQLTAIASLDGNTNSNYTFTMKHSDGTELPRENNIPFVQVNKEILFELNAPGCTKVRLMVDGREYESWNLENGQKNIRRAFNLSKDVPRLIRFQVLKDDDEGYSDFTPAQILMVNETDKLAKTTIEPINTYSLTDKSPLTIHWRAVDHATGYKVYFYYDGNRIFPFSDNSDAAYTSIPEFTYSEIPTKLFAGDKWTIEVVAIGEVGWSSSTSTSNTFHISKTIQDVEILSPVGGETYYVDSEFFVDISCFEAETYTKLILKKNNGTEAEYIPNKKGRCSLVIKEPGEYALVAYADSNPDFVINDQTIRSRPVEISVISPEIASVTDPWGNDYAVVYTNGSRKLTCQSKCNGKVKVLVDNQEKGLFALNNQLTYDYPVSNLPVGKHKVSFQIICDQSQSEVVDMPVYSVRELEESQKQPRYVSEEVYLQKYPGKQSRKKYSIGSPVTIEGVYNDFAYVTDGLYWGFIPNNSLLVAPPDLLGDMTISCSPSNNIVYTGSSIAYSLENVNQSLDIQLEVAFGDMSGSSITTRKEIKRNPDDLTKGTVSIDVDKSGIYNCRLVQKVMNDYNPIAGTEKTFYGVIRESGELYKKFSLPASRLIFNEFPDSEYLDVEVECGEKLIVKAKYEDNFAGSFYYVEYKQLRAFVNEWYVFELDGSEASRKEMNAYDALKAIANKEFTPDKRVFDPDKISHIYYLNMYTKGKVSAGHSALLLEDKNGNGLHFTLHAFGSLANGESSIGLKFMSPDEMQEYFSSGYIVGDYYTSDKTPRSFCDGKAVGYYNRVDLMGIPERKANKRNTYDNCLSLFKSAVDAGGRLGYNVLYDNCDDYALLAATGKREIWLDNVGNCLAHSVLSGATTGYVSIPAVTFEKLAAQAGKEYVTRLD